MKKGNAGGLQRDNAAAMKKKSLFRMVKPYLFLLPIYLLMVTFKYIPFGMAIIKSFFNWNGANVNLFVGLDNYIAAFRDITFTKSLVNSLWIAGADILIVLTFPLLAAELLYAVKSTKKQYVVRTAFTFPMVVPSVVIILLWKWILAGDTGGAEQYTHLRRTGKSGKTLAGGQQDGARFHHCNRFSLAGKRFSGRPSVFALLRGAAEHIQRYV